MLDLGIYLFYRLVTGLVSALPLRFLFSLGQFLGLLAWFVSGKYRRLAQRNLRIAFPAETAGNLRALSRQHFQRLGANLLCSVKLGTMPLAEVAERVTLENADALHAPLRAGRGVVLALSHFGSWELFAQIFTHHFGYAPISTVFQPLANQRIDADVRQKRSRSGAILFDRRDGFQKPMELLRRGGLVGVLCDQHAGDQGLWTPFFGRLASTTPLPGLLARRTGAAVIVAAIYTETPGRWRMVFAPPLNDAGDSVEAITAKANAAVAEQIRRAPADWFWVHNRWKTPRPNFLLARYKRGVYLPADSPAETLQPFRILVRASNWLGDCIISAPAVRALKRGRPDAHVTVAVPAKLAPVWRLIPEVDEVLPLPSKSLWETRRLFARQKPFDVAVLLPNSLRVALEAWGIPRVVGFRGHRRAWLLDQIVPPRVVAGPIEHQVRHYLHLARDLGAKTDSALDARPRRLTSGRRLGLCPGAEYGPAKRWLPERFAEVAAAFPDREWILFGTEKDARAGAEIASTLGARAVNRIGQTTLEELIAELQECRLLLTNDTGTMHLATLLGVPVVAIFGSTEDRLTGPLGPGNLVVRHHVACSPCFLRECPIDFRCMTEVTAEEVIAAVRAQLALPE